MQCITAHKQIPTFTESKCSSPFWQKHPSPHHPKTYLGFRARWWIKIKFETQCSIINYQCLTTTSLLTFCIQEPWDTKLIVGNIEGIVKVLNVARWLQGFVVDEVGAMSMDKGIEPKTIAPWTCKHKQTGTSDWCQEHKVMWIRSLVMSYLWSPECWPQNSR